MAGCWLYFHQTILMTVQDPLIKLEERLLALEFLTCPEQINPTDLVSIDNPKDSVIGGLLQTQKTLRKLGQEHRELGFFLDKCTLYRCCHRDSLML